MSGPFRLYAKAGTRTSCPEAGGCPVLPNLRERSHALVTLRRQPELTLLTSQAWSRLVSLLVRVLGESS